VVKKHVDLCSGIGGFALGFEWAQLSTPILFCDTDDWCRRILRKHWSHVPIAENVKDLANDPERLVPDCDILTSGYPCQPFSVAGKQRGAEDDRHIWPEIRTIVEAKRPTWCVFENVYGHIRLGLDEVLSDLEAIDYATQAFVVPACGVNAPHRRNRVWIIAHTHSEGESGGTIDAVKGQGELVTRRNVADTDSDDGRHRSGTKSQERQARVEHGRGGKRQLIRQPDENVADTHGARSQGRLSGRQKAQRESELGHVGRSSSTHRQPTEDWWAVEPAVGRVAHGIPRRVDRIRGLGNAIVPAIAQQIGTAIKENYHGKI